MSGRCSSVKFRKMFLGLLVQDDEVSCLITATKSAFYIFQSSNSSSFDWEKMIEKR